MKSINIIFIYITVVKINILSNFKGVQFRLVNDYKDNPINYLEIGTFHDANIISVELTYGLHKENKLYQSLI
jgi:hypothetical protein